MRAYLSHSPCPTETSVAPEIAGLMILSPGLGRPFVGLVKVDRAADLGPPLVLGNYVLHRLGHKADSVASERQVQWRLRVVGKIEEHSCDLAGSIGSSPAASRRRLVIAPAV